MSNRPKIIRVGVLVPYTNTNLEADLARLLPPNTSAHFTRIGGYDLDEVPDAAQMQRMGKADLGAALQLIAGVRPDVVLYGCTSATLTHGVGFDRILADQIKTITGATAITAAGALKAGLQAIGAKQIGFASPYVGDVNLQATRFLSDAGFETVNCADIGCALSSHGQGALTPDQVYQLALQADHPGADAIVMACTDLCAVQVIERVEEKLNKPVITSNQAMVFAFMKAFGLSHNMQQFGRLFEYL